MSELRGFLDTWAFCQPVDVQSQDEGPFSGIKLSGADVFYLMADHWRRASGTSLATARRRLMRASTNIYSKELRLLEDRAGSLNLTRADLSRADLTNAWLRRVTLRWANLDCAHFPAANLEAANIDRARAECANFHRAHLDRATVRKARLEGSHFEFAHLIEVDFTDTFLTEAEFQGALIAEAIFRGARIAGARFHGARLDGADLRGANLERATWYVRPRPTELGPGDISPECREAINELSNPDSVPATLGAAVLARVIFDSNTTLANVTVGNREETVGLADATYNGVGLTRITWPRSPLADEHVPYDARYIPIHTSLDDIIEDFIESRGSSMQRRLRRGVERIRQVWAGEGATARAEVRRQREERLRDRIAPAARANMQLAIVLRAQGMRETADYYTFRSYQCRRKELATRNRYLPWLALSLFGVIVGYGYRPLNLLLIYSVAIIGFGTAYLATSTDHLHTWQAMVYSVTAFHGRGVGLTGGLDKTGEILSAVEAIIGLVIEAAFVAAVVQRVFDR